MKVFVINDFVPYPTYSGAIWRVYGLLKYLCRHEDVVLFAPTRVATDARGIAHLQQTGISVETVGKPPGVRRSRAAWMRLNALFTGIPTRWVMTWDGTVSEALSAAISKHSPDVILVEHLSNSRYRSVYEVGKPLALDQHNVEHIVEANVAVGTRSPFLSLLRRLEARKVRALEGKMMARFDLVIAVSEADRATLQEMAPGTTMVTIPNGVDLDEFTVAEPVTDNTLVFTGTLDYQPNIEGAQDLARLILPRVRQLVPDAKTKIVGRHPIASVRALAGEALEVVPDVEDIRPYIREAAVVVVPLRSGSGTRLKILEAMATGKAIVSTRRGAEGLEVADGYDLILRDDPEEFADAVADLLKSPDERRRIGLNARATVEAKYGYPALAEKLSRALNALVEHEARSAAG